MRIVLTGGGSGGHLFPLIAVARKLREKLGPEAELLYIGSGAPLEQEVITREGIPSKFVKSGKIRRYFAVQNFLDLFKVPLGFLQALWILFRFMPDTVFSKGGYAAVPVVLVAWIYRIPVLIHESDATPGVANKFLGNFATRIAVAYPSAEKEFPRNKTALIGNPVREELVGADPTAARVELGLSVSKPVLLVIGGSQGARVINEAVGRILPKLLPLAQVVHVVGAANFAAAESLAASQGVKAGHDGYWLFEFLEGERLGSVYAAASLVISRAGANSIAEIAANRKPAILIPLDGSANDHQRKNAYELQQVGAALVLEENNLGENLLLQKIEKLLTDQVYAAQLAGKLEGFYHSAAASVLAEGVIEIKR